MILLIFSGPEKAGVDSSILSFGAIFHRLGRYWSPHLLHKHPLKRSPYKSPVRRV